VRKASAGLLALSWTPAELCVYKGYFFFFAGEEALAQCLLSATKLALDGKLIRLVWSLLNVSPFWLRQEKLIKTNTVWNSWKIWFLKHSEKYNFSRLFVLGLLSCLSIQLQCSHPVSNWAPDIQVGVFDMVELLVDLIAARLSYAPVPVKLLETLAVVFDYDSNFQRKNRARPYDRSLYDKHLNDRTLANPPSTSTFSMYNRNETYGWLCQLINRFVAKDGIPNLKDQFRSEKPLTAVVRNRKAENRSFHWSFQEYNALLSPFVNCMDYLFVDRYRQLFGEHIDQAIEYIQSLKEEDFKAKVCLFQCDIFEW
jgi:hypothetical protein